MWNKAPKVVLAPLVLLLVCPLLACPKQVAQQSRPPVIQFGQRQQKTNPASLPPGARPPDRLLRGAMFPLGFSAQAFSPDGKWLVWGGYDNRILIWNAATGAQQRELVWPRPRFDQVTEIVFSPDGNRLASATDRGDVKVWDFQTGRGIYSLKLRTSSPRLAFSSDGKVWAAFAAGPDKDSTLQIESHDAATGKLTRTIPTKWYGAGGMVLTREGQLIASGTINQDNGDEEDPHGTVQVWNLSSGISLKTSPVLDGVGPISLDGRFMASTDSSQGKAPVVVTDLSNGHTKWTFPLQSDSSSLVFSPDSRELAVSGSDHGLTVWSLITGAKISYVHEQPDPNDPRWLTALAFSPDGNRIAAGPYPVASAKIWDVPTGRELRDFAGQFSIQVIALSPDGKWLASAAPGVNVQNPATGQIFTSLTLEDADMLAFSSDGRWLAANPGSFPGGQGRSLEVWDTRTWLRVIDVAPPRDPRRNLPVQWLAFGNPSPEGTLGEADSLRFTSEGQSRIVWFSDSPLAVSPDGKLLAEPGSPTNMVDVWDISSGQKVQSFAAHQAGTRFLAFSSDGRSLLTIGQDYRYPLEYRVYPRTNLYTVKLWDISTWKLLMSFQVPIKAPSCAALSPDGRLLAIERSREIVELADARTGKSLGYLAAPAPSPALGADWSFFGRPNLAFSPDGSLLYQGAKTGIRVWKISRNTTP